MRKLWIVYLSVMFVFSGLYADVVNKDEIKKVKKIAVISFYSTKKIMCWEPKRGSTNVNDYMVKDPAQSDAPAGWKGVKQSETDLNALCQTALAIYQDSLAKAGYWEVVPFDKIKDNAAYKTPVEVTEVHENLSMTMMRSVGKGGKSSGAPTPEPKRMSEAEYKVLYRVAEGMRCLPADMFREAGTTRFGGNDPYQNEKKALGDICKGLGIDGVAIISFNPMFKYGSWARLKVGEYVKASPRVRATFVVLGSDGKVAAETGEIVNKLGWDYEGPTVNMIKSDELMLADKDMKDGFAATIQESAGRLKEILSKEFSKIK
jgi:hypothetical protein